MDAKKPLTQHDVEAVFERIGSGYPLYGSPELLDTRKHEGGIVFTRLSDNSVPPPTGRLTDANLERTSK